jgi:hypothetical protein
MQHNKNQYCLNLKLSFEVLDVTKDMFDTTNIPYYGFSQIAIEKNLIDINLTTFLDSLNISVSHAEAFYTLPGKKIPIHVDTDIMDDHCKLNFVYGDSGSKMRWWAPKDETQPIVQVTSIGTKYLMFSPDQCNLVWEAEVGCPSLVNAGRPHSVDNCTDSPRRTLSLVLYNKNKKQLLDWHDAVDIFKKFITD